MSKSNRYMLLAGAVIALSVVLTVYFLNNKQMPIAPYTSAGRTANIHPDYSDTVIPANIAPLNFAVKEKGRYYYVKIYSDKGKPIEIFSKNSAIVIPKKAWSNLLGLNRGGRLSFEIYVKAENEQWERFEPVTNKIADEDIDSFVVYRKMHPTNALLTGHTGVYQRNLRTYDEKTIIDRNYLGQQGCANCHAFCKHNPRLMMLGVRSPAIGSSTLFVHEGKIDKIDAKFGFSSWHPSGKVVAYSLDYLPMFFHSASTEIRDTVDIDSCISYYDVNSQAIKTNEQLEGMRQLETWPVWSADGKYLYFCRTPMLWTDLNKIPPERYKDVKYNLVRISYDVNSSQWGQIETILSNTDNGKSIVMPKISPDGRWISFCMCDYSFFPTWQKSSDLYLVDLEKSQQTGQYTPMRLSCSSDESESWHSWSSNSRWIVFCSKRDYGVFTRLYLAYIDSNGLSYKPLIIPQKDPFYYDSLLLGYNTPEFITASLDFFKEELGQIARRSNKISVGMPITQATPKAEGASGRER